jgi:4-hydroxy-tetrahydrodipicolinate reductase
MRVVVPGAGGKMGRMVIDAVLESGGQVTGAVERRGHPLVGRPAAVDGVVVGDDFAAALEVADVYIDFTAPEAAQAHVEAAAARRVAGIIGTTGLSPEARAAIMHAAAHIPVVVAPNFSLGVTLLGALVEQAARLLGEGYDMEIVELHHRAKRDAPSGTALALGEAMARGRGLELASARRNGRDGDVGARPAAEIGFHAVRGGDVVGEHTAHFLGPGERVEITHRASSRAVFARGAVRAARWALTQPPGVYSMRDVLGL